MYRHEDTKPNEPCDPVFGQLTKEGVKEMKDVGNQLVEENVVFTCSDSFISRRSLF